ncbi:MAG: AMP-binding protein [Clostridia bacterium]|nr:AMP-binding protein [Clostridia bacterium]
MIVRKKTPRIYTPAKDVRDLTHIFKSHGAKIAFRYFRGKQLLSMSYSEFADLITSIAAGFDAMDLAGKRVAIIGEASPQWVATYLGTIAAGGVAIPMDKEVAIEELEGFMTFAEADAVVYSSVMNEKLANAVANHPTVTNFFPISTDKCSYLDNPKVKEFDDLVALGQKHIHDDHYALKTPKDLHRMAVMLFTSGTTGSSKCVMLCENNVIAAANAACSAVDFSKEDTIVSVLPIHHTYELCIEIAALIYGMEICVNDSLKHVMRNFEQFKPTGLPLVPLFVNTMDKRIWETARKKGKDKVLKGAIKLSGTARKMGIDIGNGLFKDVTSAFGGRLNKIISGGAPLNTSVVADFDAFGIQICEGYGITECSPLVAVNPYFAPKLGSVGPAVECCRVRIEPDHIDDQGRTIGEIQVKGDNVMLGYYKNEEETAKVFTRDGWFRTGDLGYMDEDKYIFITGRKKSVIVLENGKNVFPEEIEEYLENIDTIAECVVLGRQSDDGIKLTAVIYPNYDKFDKDTAPEQIKETISKQIKELNKSLVAYKQIRIIEFRSTEFEKTTSRKIKRHLIK